MKKNVSALIILVLSLPLVVAACGVAGEKTPTAVPSLPPLPASLPKIDRSPAPINYERGKLAELPSFDPNADPTWQMDLRTYDLSGLDFSQSAADLEFASFDSRTVWPAADRLPPGYDARRILELGKDPGLSLKQLHTNNINGYGVGIAIIDQTLLVNHQEYASQLRLYEENSGVQGGWMVAQMHGPAVASIAVGKTVGVAPAADLYYIAAVCVDSAREFDFGCLAQSIDRVLAINQQLPEGRKIRVLSMSIGWSSDDKGYAEISAAAQRARDAGLLVICSSVDEVHGFNFSGLGRASLADPNQFSSYAPGNFWTKDFFAGIVPGNRLLVPMDSRTVASPEGTGEYVFYRTGGWSWAIPYIGGVYALAAQVKPAITPDKFWRLALQTGRTITVHQAGKDYQLSTILDPVALITELQNSE